MELKHFDVLPAITVSLPLLIVPYGIETIPHHVQSHPHILLIVPYGIETAFFGGTFRTDFSFNRTLWN